MQASERIVGVEEKRAALRHVLESRTFARSDQLRHFLSYVCEMDFVGRSGEINEYAIGIDALGRPKEYSPQDDSTVRSRAYSLRQKLQEYYEKERADAPLRIELPKGSYIPLFVEAVVALSPAPALGPAPGSQPAAPARHWVGAFAAGVAASSLVWLACLAFLPSKPGKVDPIVVEAWGMLARPDAQVALSLGSPPHLHLRSFGDSGRPTHNPPLIDATPEATAFYETFHLVPPRSPVYMYRTNNSLLLGDAIAAALAVKTLTLLGASFELLPEKVAGHIVLRGRNVMRFGSASDSSEVARELARAAFTIRYDPSIPDEVITDKPVGTPGAQVFRPKRGQDGYNYCLLTVMPVESSGGQRRIVIASGISSAGTQVAMEFFTSPVYLKALKQRFAAEGHPTFPPAYQVVLKYTAENGAVADYSYQTHTVLR